MALRLRTPHSLVEPVLEGLKEDWPTMDCPPNKSDFAAHKLPVKIKGESHLNFIAKRLTEKGVCQLMILGPGEGSDLIWLRQGVGQRLEDPSLLGGLKIDVLGLTKTLNPKAQKIARHDFSGSAGNPTLFENYENPKLEDKYDFALGTLSVGYYTRHPNLALVKTAGMLVKDGFSVLEIGLWGDSQPKSIRADPKKIIDACQRFWETQKTDKRFAINYESVREDVEHQSHWFIINRIK